MIEKNIFSDQLMMRLLGTHSFLLINKNTSLQCLRSAFSSEDCLIRSQPANLGDRTSQKSAFLLNTVKFVDKYCFPGSTEIYTWDKKIATFQNCVDVIHSCAIECYVPFVEHIQGNCLGLHPERQNMF